MERILLSGICLECKGKRQTHEKFLHKVLSLLVEPLGEGIFELLDFLPISKPSENETTRDHLIDDASQSPEIRAVCTRIITNTSDSTHVQHSACALYAPLAAFVVLQKLW